MATTVEVGNIQARITATTGRFESAVRRVNSRLGSVEKSAQRVKDRIRSTNRVFDDFNRRLEKVGQIASRMQKWIGATFAAQAASIGLAVRQAAAYAGQMSAVAGQTGLAVETVQALSYVAQQSDADVKLLSTGLRAFTRRTAEAAQGNRTFAKYFEQLGVRVKEVDGSLRPLEDVLMDVADRVKGLSTESEASAALMGLMGDAGRQLVPMMRRGSSGIRDLMQEARSLGLVLDRETISRLTSFSDQVTRTQLRMGALSREWALHFLPLAERIIIRVDNIVRAFQSLDDEQKALIFRFGSLAAAVMAGGFAFSTFLVILPQLVKGLQIVAAVMGTFASPWVLAIGAVVAATYLLKAAWDENLLGVQERTEAVTAAVRRAWERLVNWFTGERDIMEAPAELLGSRRRISPEGRLIIEPRERGRFTLPSLPAPDWDKVVDDAANRLKSAWENAKQTVASFAKIELPGVEWPGWPEIDTEGLKTAWENAKQTVASLTKLELPGIEWPGWPQIDTEPLKTQWQALKAEIEALEPPSLPRIDPDPFFESWDRFVEGVRNLEPPPPPPGLEDWTEKIAERFKRTPAGQVVLNVGELSRQVMAGEKTLSEAVTELLSSNLSIPFTALLWTLTPLGTGWKLALTGVTLALNFLPDVDLSAGNINRLIGDVSEKITALLRKEDLITIGDETYSVSRLSESLGRVLGEAIAEAIGLAIGLASALLGIPELDSRAYELGKAIGQEIIVPFARGLAEGFSQAIRRAWQMALEQETQEHLFQIGLLPGETRRRAQELSQQLEGRQFFFEAAPTPSIWERLQRWWRGLPGFQGGTPWTGWGPLDEVAGVVHRQEAVIPADVLRAGPAAVLEFLGAPGFQTGKLGAPLGMATLREEGAKLTQLNEKSLRELVDLSRVTEGLSAAWDRAGAKLEEMAAGVPALQDLVRLVRTLVDLVRTSGEPPRPTATLHIPEPAPTLWDRVRSLFERGLGWLREQGQVAGERMREFGANILQALTPVALLTELLTVLAEPVAALLMPITMVAAALAQALLPVFKTMFPIIKTFGIVVLTIAQGIATVWNSIVGTIGGIFKALSDISILGWRPLKFLEGTAKFFLGLQIDTKALSDAQRELRNLTWEEAMARAKNIEAIERTTEALRNVPTGFKVALERFRAATPTQSFATGGYVPATPGGRIVRVAEGGEGEYIIPESRMGRGITVNVTVEGDVYGVDDLDRRITSAIRRAFRQGSMATFGVS